MDKYFSVIINGGNAYTLNGDILETASLDKNDMIAGDFVEVEWDMIGDEGRDELEVIETSLATQRGKMITRLVNEELKSFAGIAGVDIDKTTELLKRGLVGYESKSMFELEDEMIGREFINPPESRINKTIIDANCYHRVNLSGLEDKPTNKNRTINRVMR